MGACASKPAVSEALPAVPRGTEDDGASQRQVPPKRGDGPPAAASSGALEASSSSAPSSGAPAPDTPDLDSKAAPAFSERTDAQIFRQSAPLGLSAEGRPPSAPRRPPLVPAPRSLSERLLAAAAADTTAQPLRLQQPQQQQLRGDDSAAGPAAARDVPHDGGPPSAFAAASSQPAEQGGAGYAVSLKMAMSMPGEREAQQMLRGRTPMARAQTMMGGIPRPQQQQQQRLPGKADGAELPAAPIKGIEQTPEPSLDHILGLAQAVFRTDSVLLHLRDGDEVFARGDAALYAPAVRAQACRLLEPLSDAISVVEDPGLHPRVKGEPGIAREVKFFAAAPLIAANGYRLGSLCLCHSKPRAFEAANRMIMGNMADLMVREIWGAYEHAHRQRVLQLVRVVDCYSEPLLFVEASQTQPWRVLHMNDAAVSTTGLEKATATNKPFWDTFTGVEESNAVKQQAVGPMSEVGAEFTLDAMRAISAETSAVPLTLVFRPAAMEALAEDEAEAGARGEASPEDTPRWGANGGGGGGARRKERQRPLTNAGRYYYFVGVRLDADASSCSAAERAPFIGLQLGLLLGRGSYGRVYKGYYHGRVVAVKVCDSSKVRRNKEGLPVEVDLAAKLVHPNLVRTIEAASIKHEAPPKLDWELQPVQEADESAAATSGGAAAAGPAAEGQGREGSGGRVPGKEPPVQAEQAPDMPAEETWLLLEYCDQGSLVDAITGGWFRTGSGGQASLSVVLATAAEIASGMSCLHSRGIVHGDLSSGNILLTSGQNSNSHGFCAKVSDFGLARDMDVVSRVETKTTGTVTHMPPEVLSHGIVSKAADVYAFGVLLWEMLTGRRAWDKMTPAQVMLAVALQQDSLSFPSWTPPELARLGQQCLQFDADNRPDFKDVSKIVRGMQARLSESGADERVELNSRALSCPR